MENYEFETHTISRIKDQLSPLDRTLRGLPTGIALEALSLLEKISRKILLQPGEEKWRRLSKFNAKLLPILGNKAGLNIMRELGWQVDRDYLVLPYSVQLEFKQHVSKIIDARHYYKEAILSTCLHRRASAPDARIQNWLYSPASKSERQSSPRRSTISDASTTLLSSDGRGSIANTESLLSEPGETQSPVSPCGVELTEKQQDTPGGKGAGIMWCNLGHELSWSRLKFHQGWVHKRECSCCGATIAREAIRLRCEECRLSPCVLGCNRDTYSICSACSQCSRDHYETDMNEKQWAQAFLQNQQALK